MIIDIPTAEEYENNAIECLIQAYNNIYSVDSSLNNDTPRDKIWKYNQIILRTAVVLIHQGMEGLMKADVCCESPLLLIDKKKSEWKTLPDSGDEAFAQLFTLGGDDLLRIYFACVPQNEIHPEFLKHYTSIREKRNKIVHGLGQGDLKPEDIIILILRTFTYLLGKDEFWDAVIDKLYQHPGFEHDDDDLLWEEDHLYTRMDYLTYILSKSELKKHFSIDISKRAYYCPECTQGAEGITKEGDLWHPTSKWAFINPNLPESTNLTCVVCKGSFSIIRENCKKQDCKGNVLHIESPEDEIDENNPNFCLTCWKDQAQ